MDNRFTNLPSDIVNLIYEYDGTYREKYNSVVKVIEDLEDEFDNRLERLMSAGMGYENERRSLEKFYHVRLRNLKVIQEYNDTINEAMYFDLEKDAKEATELTDIEKLFLFIDEN